MKFESVYGIYRAEILLSDGRCLHAVVNEGVLFWHWDIYLRGQNGCRKAFGRQTTKEEAERVSTEVAEKLAKELNK